MTEVPKIDTRISEDVARELYARLHLNHLHEDQRKQRADAALVQVFSRFSEIVIDRLNKAPNKKFLAFLDFLGLAPIPPQAATVPLTFVFAPRASSYALVPAGTRVSATPPGGGQKPVVFETLSELVVSALEIDSLFVKKSEDRYQNLAAALLPVSGPPQETVAAVPERAVSATEQPIPHLFYIPVPAFTAVSTIDRLSLQFAIEAEPSAASATSGGLQWEIGSGSDGLEPNRMSKVLVPEADTTENLAKTGAVSFQSLPPVPLSLVDGKSARWLCCRQLSASTPESESDAEPAQPGVWPRITEVMVAADLAKAGLRPELAFYERLALDLSKDFLPFGQRPRLGDAFYFACREAFSEQAAVVTLHVQATSGEAPGTEPAVPHVSANRAELRWEFWDGQAWMAVSGRKPGSEPAIADPGSPIIDQTLALSRGGKVEFTFPSLPAELNLNGIKSYWVRVRISNGDYGRDVQVQRDAATGEISVIPATLNPPSIRAITIDYSLRKDTKPEVILLDEWKLATVSSGSPWRPFTPAAPANLAPALYAGFKALPTETATAEPQATALPDWDLRRLPSFPVNAFVLIDELAADKSLGPEQSRGIWEYWSKDGWKRFVVADETKGFRKSGLIQLIPPKDFVVSNEFAKDGYWLRARLSEQKAPPIRAVLPNTTTAIEGQSITNDILGSSSGEPGQKFRSTYPSVLTGQRLEVCEPTVPSKAEREALDRLEERGESAVQPATNQTGKTVYWVKWREVDSFHASGARDRHYVLDHVSGEVFFGDGVNGMIPPILGGNIRMSYRTGGGSIGNQPAQAVKQLVSAVPYVQKVVNWMPATGGSDAEPMEAFVERGPREMRHLGRAVTREDFEDLALKSSREVARARCIPQYDLRKDPSASCGRPGLISVIVVPRSEDVKPAPSADLLERVKTYLDARRLLTAELAVVGPEYVRVDVEADIVVNRVEDVNRVEQTVAVALDRYLHPVRGGATNSGWEFGHLPQRSHLYALIEKIPGVSYVGSLNLTMIAERPEAGKARHLLVHSGQHSLNVSL
jgi:Baseplate J-like protein